jgi:hypothetical protein
MLASFFLDYLIFMLRFFVPQLFRLIPDQTQNSFTSEVMQKKGKS